MRTTYISLLLLISINLFANCSPDKDPVIIDNEQTVDPDGYHLVWQDLFEGTILDETTNWIIEVNGDGGGNAELQYYKRENISVGQEPVSGNNCLIITAKKENYLNKTATSGRLTTQAKMFFKYGKIEARIKLPHTANGLWPAFWMLGADFSSVGWPRSGEIDIMEMGNSTGISNGTQDRHLIGACHWGQGWNGGSYPNYAKATVIPYGIQDDFHLFTLVWDSLAVKMYLDLDKYPDNEPYYEMNISDKSSDTSPGNYFQKPFFIILNLAVGGNFTGIWNINQITALNDGDAKMYVDYVKVYQKGDAGEEYYGSTLNSSAKNISTKTEYRIYPNPSFDKVKIEGTVVPASITVYAESGIEMLKFSNTTEINVSSLPAGKYILKISSENNSETHLLIKY